MDSSIHVSLDKSLLSSTNLRGSERFSAFSLLTSGLKLMSGLSIHFFVCFSISNYVDL